MTTYPDQTTTETEADPFDRHATPSVRWGDPDDGPFLLVVERPEYSHPTPNALPTTDVSRDATARSLPWVGDHHFAETTCPDCGGAWRAFTATPAPFVTGLALVLVCACGRYERDERYVPTETDGE